MNEEELKRLYERAIARRRAATQAAADVSAVRRTGAPTPVTGGGRMPVSGGRMVDRAARFIADKEGFSQRAYRDTLGRGQPWTVGYGRTGPDVGPTTTMSEPDAFNWVRNRVRGDSAQMAQGGVPPNEALLSFAYNVGVPGTLRSSVGQAARTGDWDKTAAAMRQFVYGRDKQGRPVRLQGLANRREAEISLLQSILMGALTNDNQ
jgi:lysozyme